MYMTYHVINEFASSKVGGGKYYPPPPPSPPLIETLPVSRIAYLQAILSPKVDPFITSTQPLVSLFVNF